LIHFIDRGAVSLEGQELMKGGAQQNSLLRGVHKIKGWKPTDILTGRH